MITSHRYVIAVPNVDASAAYYQSVLGFDVREIGDPGWRFFERDGCVIMAGECPDAIPPSDLGDHSYFAYILLDDVDAYYRRITTPALRSSKTCVPSHGGCASSASARSTATASCWASRLAADGRATSHRRRT